MPAATPFTTPLAFTVAILVLDELHVPPLVKLLNAVVLPTQTFVVPVMAATVGKAFIVIELVTIVVHPLPFVTV